MLGNPRALSRTWASKPYQTWVLSAGTREVAQGSAKLPQNQELACHCNLQVCKVPAVSRCFLLFYKVVKDEYVTDLALHRVGGMGLHRTADSLTGDSPEGS